MRTGFLLLAVLTAGILCAAHPFRVDLRNADCFAEGNGTVPISGENIRVGRIGKNGFTIEGATPLRADRWSRRKTSWNTSSASLRERVMA